MRDAGPVAIVLGGTNPHVPLIENLKGRGYHVVLVDHLEAPPARRVADEHVRLSTLDPEAVLALARERKASLAIAACVDRANVTAAYVAGQLGLPSPYDFATASLIADKRTMKQRMVETGVPTAAFRRLGSVAEADRLPMRFPVVVKPVDCGGSKGVRKAADRGELRLAAEEAFRLTRAGEILVEEFCDGIEVGADCFVQDGEAHVLLLREKHVRRAGVEGVLSTYASVMPARLAPAARERIQRAASDIARGFGLRTTPLLVQFIVNGDEVCVIEFAPRVGGGLNYRLVQLKAGVDLVDATVNAWLGQPSELAGHDRAGYVSANHVYADAGQFGEVMHQERLLADGVVEEFYVHKARGATLGASLSSSDRVASFILRAGSAEELLRKTHEAMQRLDVLDVDGRSVIRRELCLQAL